MIVGGSSGKRLNWGAVLGGFLICRYVWTFQGATRSAMGVGA